MNLPDKKLPDDLDLIAEHIGDDQPNLPEGAKNTILLAARAIKELREVVAKLPKTADGVPVVPGDEAYRCWHGPRGGKRHEQYVVGWDYESKQWAVGRYWEGRCADGSPISFEPYQPVENYYSTRKAAEEASKP